MNPNINATPNSQAAPTTSSPNGASAHAPAPRANRVGVMDNAAFAQIVAQRDAPADANPQSPQSPAVDDPETPVQREGQVAPGQEISSPDTGAQPEAGVPEGESPDGTAPETDGTENNPESQPNGAANGELETLLSDLNEDGRKSLIDLAKYVQEGGSLQDLKRGHKLLGKHQDELAKMREEFQSQIEELRSSQSTGSNGGAGQPALPAAVAEAKTFQELQTLNAETQKAYRWCEANPNGGEYEGREYTAEQVLTAKQNLFQDLLAIPERREQIREETQRGQAVAGQQRQMRQFLEQKVPQFFASENPTWKKAADLIKNDSHLSSLPNRDYVALALAIGDAELTRMLNGRPATPNGVRNGAPKPATSGKVPLGKPHGGGGSAPSRPTDAAVVAGAAREAVMKDGSRVSLATALKAWNR